MNDNRTSPEGRKHQLTKEEEIVIKRAEGMIAKLDRLRRQILKLKWKHPDDPFVKSLVKELL